MTTTDDYADELRALVARLDRLLAQAEQPATRVALDSYGNPNYVAAGELIESAWGNAVVDHVIRIFPDEASRDIAIPDPIVGTTTFIGATGAVQVFYDAIGWKPPWNTAWGRLGDGYRDTAQPLSATSIELIRATYTTVGGRTLLTVGNLGLYNNHGGDNSMGGTVHLDVVGGPALCSFSPARFSPSLQYGDSGSGACSAFQKTGVGGTISPGTHSHLLTSASVSPATATPPMYVSVTDIGPHSAPQAT